MIKVHNLNYYYSSADRFFDFIKNNRSRNRILHFLRPDNFLINLSSHYLTNWVFFPSIKYTYAFCGYSAVKITGIFNTRLSNWIEDVRHDPIDTKTLLRLSTWAQVTSLNFALRKPVILPLVGGLDKCSISFARHIYVLSKDASTLLGMVEKLRTYIVWARGEAKTLLGKCVQGIASGIRAVADAIMQVIKKIVLTAKIPLEYIPLINILLVHMEKGIEKVRTYFQLNLLERAHQIIDNKERSIRRKVVGKIAEVGCKQSIGLVTNLALRTLFGYLVYDYAKQHMNNYFGTNPEFSDKIVTYAKWGLFSLGSYLWARSLGSMLYGLHENYKEDFDPQASTLMELATLVNGQNLYKVIQFIKSHWK